MTEFNPALKWKGFWPQLAGKGLLEFNSSYIDEMQFRIERCKMELDKSILNGEWILIGVNYDRLVVVLQIWITRTCEWSSVWQSKGHEIYDLPALLIISLRPELGMFHLKLRQEIAIRGMDNNAWDEGRETLYNINKLMRITENF